ncbi:replication initiation protein [Solibacillus sp. FSL W7-1436]|uniref:replication initiation protein n=1 Tax=Solibacillus sp. FSL W7-1436 TaxID=2921705 RepID=UPI0030F6C0A6
MELLKVKDNFKVTMHKKLIEASFSDPLTIQEQRILYAVISNIPSPEFVKENGQYVLDEHGKKIISNRIESLPPFEVPLKDLAKAIGIKEMEYDVIKSLSRKFMSKVIEIDSPDGSFEHLQWLFNSKYVAGTGKIIIELSPKLYPYLLNLTDNFASVNLGTLMKFKCKYTSRLYLLLEQWGKVSHKEFTPDELRGILGVAYEEVKGKKVYKLANYTHLKQRALTPAIEEINKHTNFKIEMIESVNGRKVVSIKFKITNKDKPKKSVKIPNEKPKSPVNTYEEIAQSLVHLGFNKEAYSNMAKRLMLIENIELIKTNVINQLQKLGKYITESKSELGAGFVIKEIEKAVERYNSNGQFDFNELINDDKNKKRFGTKKIGVVPDWFKNGEHDKENKKELTDEEIAYFKAERERLLANLNT